MRRSKFTLMISFAMARTDLQKDLNYYIELNLDRLYEGTMFIIILVTHFFVKNFLPYTTQDKKR